MEQLGKFKMEANFEGLIQLLAKSLYPDPDVFIRELIQNSHDSIVRRREMEPDIAGGIEITLDRYGKTIKFCDNGIGMDYDDIRKFLSVIGSTGTGNARERLQEEGREGAYQLIGQFGIGMLSAFVVAEKVVVKTRKLNETNAYEWHNDGSADCTMYLIKKDKTGTDIIVYLRDEYTALLDEKRIESVVVKYCDFIPINIRINGRGPVNIFDAPWHKPHWSSEKDKNSAYEDFLCHRYPDTPLEVIPVEINDAYKVSGALYISDKRTLDTTGVIDIFVRRMLVKANDNTLLPQWAKFVRGVIDSPDLQPTAARDNIQSNHPSFKFMQEKLGDLIVDRLKYLAENQPAKFRQINEWHHEHLKGMAYYYNDFFDKVAELLLFDTNRGSMSLGDYLTKNAPRPDQGNRVPIYYFSYEGAAAQFYSLADAKGWVVINAGRRFEEELLEEYVKKNAKRVCPEHLDTADDPLLFDKLDDGETERFKPFEADMEGVLHRLGGLNVMVRTRRFDPPHVPAVVILSKEAEEEEKLRHVLGNPRFMSAMEDIISEAIAYQKKRKPIYLFINATNPIICKLVDFVKKDGRLADLMFGIYNSAMLYSHNLLNRYNAQALHQQVVKLIQEQIDLLESNQKSRGEIEELRRKVIELNKTLEQSDALKPEQNGHIVIFVMIPAKGDYQKVEKAIRLVFEMPPYFFEVRLAKVHTINEELLSNVRDHIRVAHGFVAEISELNPNVMMELGAVIIKNDGRPVFLLRSKDDNSKVPADIEGKIYISYTSRTIPVEQIEADIRESFESSGRIKNELINKLLDLRKKHFLSRILLETLRTKLVPSEIDRVMGRYKTVEEFVTEDTTKLVDVTKIDLHFIDVIKRELEEKIKNG